HADTDTDPHADADTDTDTHAHTDTDTHADADTDTDTNAHTDADPNPDADADANSNANSNADTHADQDADADTDTYTYTDTNAVADQNAAAGPSGAVTDVTAWVADDLRPRPGDRLDAEADGDGRSLISPTLGCTNGEERIAPPRFVCGGWMQEACRHNDTRRKVVLLTCSCPYS
ncbi:MAG: hypothetical protein H6Q33_3487, partial [Deltaproteobacteria bacterium]|nr:hypothetical protein [Deltaproteobacteria bacterium]